MKKLLSLSALAIAVSVNAHANGEVYDLTGHLMDWNKVSELRIASDKSGRIVDNQGQLYELKGKYMDRHNRTLKDCKDGKFIVTRSYKFDQQMERQGWQIAPVSCDLQQVSGAVSDDELLDADYSADQDNVEQRKLNKQEIESYIKKHLSTDANH